MTAYACAKSAYFRLTGTLAAETAGHGVTVLCVSPGLVRTRMDDLDGLLADAGRVVAEDLLTLRLRKRPEG